MNSKQHVYICFLILHYIDIELTNKAIESILNLNHFNNSQIIVVDNASPNGSGELLKRNYKNMKEIHILLSESNDGFSAGNNIGFRYIKNNFISDFVIAINNDILFPQKDFIDKLNALYAEAPFWVAGPDILVPQRAYHSSPLSDKILDKKKIEAEIEKLEFKKKLISKKFSLRIFKSYIRDCYADNIVIRFFFQLKSLFQKAIKKYNKRFKWVVLQGSCLIFDRRYCEQNDNLFLPLTFMYVEEEILTRRCISNNWEIRYFPEIQVWHMCEGSSHLLGMSYRQYCDKLRIKVDRLQEANKIYLDRIMSDQTID